MAPESTRRKCHMHPRKCDIQKRRKTMAMMRARPGTVLR